MSFHECEKGGLRLYPKSHSSPLTTLLTLFPLRRAVVLTGGDAALQDIWQCPGTFLIVTAGSSMHLMGRAWGCC